MVAMIGKFKLNPFKNKGDKAYISLNFGSLLVFVSLAIRQILNKLLVMNSCTYFCFNKNSGKYFNSI